MKKGLLPGSGGHHTRRPIDKNVSTAYHRITSSFAVVSKLRAKVWLIVAVVLFIAGFAAAISYVSHQGEEQQFAGIPVSQTQAASTLAKAGSNVRKNTATLRKRFIRKSIKTKARNELIVQQQLRLKQLEGLAINLGSNAPQVAQFVLPTADRDILALSGIPVEQVVPVKNGKLVSVHGDCLARPCTLPNGKTVASITSSHYTFNDQNGRSQTFAYQGPISEDLLNEPSASDQMLIVGGTIVPLQGLTVNSSAPRTVNISGQKSFVAIVMDFAGGAANPYSNSEVSAAMDVVSDFYKNQSSNTLSFSYNVVHGSVPPGTFNCMLNAGGDAARSAGNVTKGYDFYVYIFPNINCGNVAAWIDIGDNQLYINGNTAALTQAIAHEGGHSFGMGHAGSGGLNGNISTYGHCCSVMGNRATPPGAGDLSSLEKQTSGFPVTVQSGGVGTYTLMPVDGPKSGTQGLRVTAGTTELRLDTRQGGSILSVETPLNPWTNGGYVDDLQLAVLSAGGKYTLNGTTITYVGNNQVSITGATAPPDNGSGSGSGSGGSGSGGNSGSGGSGSGGSGSGSGSGSGGSGSGDGGSGGGSSGGGSGGGTPGDGGAIGNKDCEGGRGCLQLLCPATSQEEPLYVQNGAWTMARIRAQGDYQHGIVVDIPRYNRSTIYGPRAPHAAFRASGSLGINSSMDLAVAVLGGYTPPLSGLYHVPIEATGLVKTLASARYPQSDCFVWIYVTGQSGNSVGTPSVSLKANSQEGSITVGAGTNVTINLMANHASSCVTTPIIAGNWYNTSSDGERLDVKGEITIAPWDTVTYTATCRYFDRSQNKWSDEVSDSLTINVVGTRHNFGIDCNPNTVSIERGQSANVDVSLSGQSSEKIQVQYYGIVPDNFAARVIGALDNLGPRYTIEPLPNAYTLPKHVTLGVHSTYPLENGYEALTTPSAEYKVLVKANTLSGSETHSCTIGVRVTYLGQTGYDYERNHGIEQKPGASAPPPTNPPPTNPPPTNPPPTNPPPTNPTISITSPANNASVSGNFQVTANAVPAIGSITRMKFFVDDFPTPLNHCLNPIPPRCMANIMTSGWAAGSTHVITAAAVDSGSVVEKAYDTVTVIYNPGSGSSSSGSATSGSTGGTTIGGTTSTTGGSTSGTGSQTGVTIFGVPSQTSTNFSFSVSIGSSIQYELVKLYLDDARLPNCRPGSACGAAVPVTSLSFGNHTITAVVRNNAITVASAEATFTKQ